MTAPAPAGKPTALIAEDESLLAFQLQADLRELWPDLQIVGVAGNGVEALHLGLSQKPQVCFLDIRMPGMDGLDVAEALAEDWPEGTPLPLIVFVTAYDQYALQAFERSASDYLLKPVQKDRLARSVQVIRQRLAERSVGPLASGVSAQALSNLAGLLQQWAPVAGGAAPGAPQRLRVIQAAVGQQIVMVPVAEVLLFEAADKYIRVITAERELLIRLSLRELLPQIDPEEFWQVHRGTVVRAEAIERATRDEAGKLTLTIKGLKERPVVSRLHAHRFKGM